MLPTISADVVFVAVTELIFPVPLAAIPITVLLLDQEYVVPETFPVKD